MPDKVYEFIAVIVVILILTVLIWLAYLLVATEVDTNVKVAVLASLGAVSAALATHWLTKTREIEARHFEKKRQCYEAIIENVQPAVYFGAGRQEDFTTTVDKGHCPASFGHSHMGR